MTYSVLLIKNLLTLYFVSFLSPREGLNSWKSQKFIRKGILNEFLYSPIFSTIYFFNYLRIFVNNNNYKFDFFNYKFDIVKKVSEFTYNTISKF